MRKNHPQLRKTSGIIDTRSRSRSGGFLFLGTNNTIESPLNGTLHCEVKIIKNVMSSVAEAEIGALFLNTKPIIPIRTTLHELGHIHPPSPVQTDNLMAQGFATKSMKQRKSKAIEMNFYWVQDQQHLGNVDIFWRPKELNMVDYFTKHHAPIVHRKCVPLFYMSTILLACLTSIIYHMLRGCVDSTYSTYVHLATTAYTC